MAERAAKQLELNKSELPNSITEVIATLTRAGFDAYIVGGGVRDTLLGLRPKDFDAVTDAKPMRLKTSLASAAVLSVAVFNWRMSTLGASLSKWPLSVDHRLMIPIPIKMV